MKIKSLIIGIVCGAVILPVFVLATPPQLPHIFYGNVTNGGAVVPVNTIIIAKVDGVEKGRVTVSVAGEYGGPNALDKKLLVQGSFSSSDVVKFYIGDNVADQEVLFSTGVVRNLDLTFNVPASGGGGGGGSYTLPAEVYATGDMNGDNIVNKFDFALMMSAWGKTGIGLAADLNDDGIVDKYDFALLMLNWGK